MQIDQVHFYVEDARELRKWFVECLGFDAVASGENDHTLTEVVQNGSVYFVLFSPVTQRSPIARFLERHPPGVADLVFRVEHLVSAVARAINCGAEVLQPVQICREPQGSLKWSKLSAWGALNHTLIERTGLTPLLPNASEWGLAKLPLLPSTHEKTVGHLHAPDMGLESCDLHQIPICFTEIDHVVLNVPVGELQQAVQWYANVLGFQPRQTFEIQTAHSGLCSRVMVHPLGRVQLPINEPSSMNSQIQEFLNWNRGAGIQHIALHTVDIVSAIARLRSQGMAFLEVPPAYYSQLRQRGLQLSQADWQALETQQILVDWQLENADALLLQTFTQPVFQQPTFFFELIERRQVYQNGQLKRAQGFGEGNFRALFEAIEQEQVKRGSLEHPRA